MLRELIQEIIYLNGQAESATFDKGVQQLNFKSNNLELLGTFCDWGPESTIKELKLEPHRKMLELFGITPSIWTEGRSEDNVKEWLNYNGNSVVLHWTRIKPEYPRYHERYAAGLYLQRSWFKGNAKAMAFGMMYGGRSSGKSTFANNMLMQSMHKTWAQPLKKK
jgi:hypothetical protein